MVAFIATMVGSGIATADEPDYIEVVNQRTQDSKTFHLGGLNYQTEFAEALHYKNDNNEWADSILEFQPVGGTRWEMITHPFYHAEITTNTVTMTHPDGPDGIKWYTPSNLTVGTQTASYVNDGLTWVYKLEHKGVKLTANVAERRGPRIYTFASETVGGLLPLAIDPFGNAVSGWNQYLPSAGNLGAAAIFFSEEGDDVQQWLQTTPRIVVPRPVIIGDDKQIYPAGHWIVENGLLSFSFDDTDLPDTAFPYVIDPTSEFDIATGADDGLAYANPAGSYPPSCTAGNDSAASHDVSRYKSGANYGIQLGVVRWDTGALPDNATVTAASLRLYLASKTDTDSRSAVMGWYVHDGSIACDDFSATAGTNAHSGTAISSLTTGANNTFALANLSNVSLSSYTGMRINVSGSTPTGSNSFEFAALEHASFDPPRLSVTYTVPAPAITGTIGNGASEQDVRDGAGTIIATLTGDTFVASFSDPIKQAIIDGLDAASTPTNGWNNEVRDKITVGSVARTSGTIATITLAASEVAGYRITSNEIITMTVPATALTSAVAITATPTITITAGLESVAMAGTIGGSGGVPSEIVAGNETIILTLTNTKWAITADFNAQRQNILDGLVSDTSDVHGWNSLAFAVGDVIRTSDTIVTITLSAESAYAIPSAETISATVPASALVHSEALVAPQTFAITPAFVASGTRVSTAINLSGITDLAYCAIGWESTLPANTTVAIETSINGGATYSTATNGNCPTGLTLGESLSTITDFRVKGTLTTTNTAATPLITALGLILEDAGGSTLCYQLKTTPSASLADNCGTYTGTMSYPIGPSTITNTTAPITSTADPLPNARSLAGQDVAQAVTGSATSARLFPAAGDEGGFVGLPLNDLVNDMSTVGDGLPVRFVWFIFLGIATIGAGMLAVHLTSNLFIAAGAMAAVMGFQMAIGSTGLLPGWILFAFIPLAGSFLLFRRGFPV